MGETLELPRTGSPLWTQTFLGVFALAIGIVMVKVAGHGSPTPQGRRQVRPLASSGTVRPPVLLLNEPWTPTDAGRPPT